MPLRDRSGLSSQPFWHGVVPECIHRFHPPLSLVCPWTLVRSWEHLPFSLSLSLFLSFLHLPSSLDVPGRFRHSWEPFLFGVSLDACVVAGSTLVSSFLSFSFLPPLPPLFPRVRRVYKQTRLLQGFSMRFGLSSVSPLSFGFPFIGPHRRLPFFSFMSFLSSCLCILILSFSCAHFRPDLSLYTYTHRRTRILLTTRFRWPRFVTMRFGSSVVPLHLVFLHRQPHTLFVCLVFLMFICLFCVRMCFA